LDFGPCDWIISELVELDIVSNDLDTLESNNFNRFPLLISLAIHLELCGIVGGA